MQITFQFPIGVASVNIRSNKKEWFVWRLPSNVLQEEHTATSAREAHQQMCRLLLHQLQAWLPPSQPSKQTPVGSAGNATPLNVKPALL